MHGSHNRYRMWDSRKVDSSRLSRQPSTPIGPSARRCRIFRSHIDQQAQFESSIDPNSAGEGTVSRHSLSTCRNCSLVRERHGCHRFTCRKLSPKSSAKSYHLLDHCIRIGFCLNILHYQWSHTAKIYPARSKVFTWLDMYILLHTPCSHQSLSYTWNHSIKQCKWRLVFHFQGLHSHKQPAQRSPKNSWIRNT